MIPGTVFVKAKFCVTVTPLGIVSATLTGVKPSALALTVYGPASKVMLKAPITSVKMSTVPTDTLAPAQRAVS